mmetsp:Transcript_10376/g.15602  ORF Transcript_10376/g.15602 Transcript_10376/m.15602 type:complete len:292 (-) Transcript_10376:25-900(-)
MHRFITKAVPFSSREVGKFTRRYTPPARALALYEKDFHLDYKFPVDTIDSSEVRYAQFLYRLQDDSAQPENSDRGHDFMQDFAALEQLNLPIFWERELDVLSYKEFRSRCHEDFIFLMKWMQSNGDLGRIGEVKQQFELFLNEKNKQVNVSIYAPVMTTEELEKVKPLLIEKARVLMKKNPALASKKDFGHKFYFHSDATLSMARKEAELGIEGAQFYIEVAGVRISHDPQSKNTPATGRSHVEPKTDYSRIKPARSIINTEWDNNVEASILSTYYEHLAKTDQEEQIYGV